MSKHQQMSLEAALEEEARDVMALLEGRQSQPSPRAARMRAASPSNSHASPVRSMLDIADLAPGVPRSQHLTGQRAASIAGDRVSPTGSTFSDTPTVRSMLDFGGGPIKTAHRPKRQSFGSTSPPPTGLPTIKQGVQSPKFNPEENYKFEMLPPVDSNTRPKRVGQGGKKGQGALSTVFGQEGKKGGKSRSPGPGRSQSPSTRLLNNNGMNLMGTPGTYVTDTGKVIDMNQAYRKLSDAALIRSGGKLGNLASNKPGATRGEEIAPDGSVRLIKDYDDDDVIEGSDEDDSGGSSDEEFGDNERGRGRTRKDSDAQEKEPYVPITAKSLLAAAEEESTAPNPNIKKKWNPRIAATTEKVEQHSEGQKVSSQKVRSLLDPEPSVTLTSPTGEKLKPGKPSIHPRTSFDVGGMSGISTPVDSDEEQTRSDINTAQKMTLTLSPIHSTPEAHRCIRQILRGDYRRYQQEAEEGLRRQRMYLVATDLSDEAAYALEWTVGTVLRDGDTLLAVYAVDEEMGTGGDASSTATNTGVGIGEGANQMKDAAAIVRTLSNQEGLVVPGELTGKASSSAGDRSLSHIRNKSLEKGMERAERERHHATEAITERCIKLLRKTKLQVRVVVEVFHCKSPKHMITEVIDYLEPTLVILGSRGRSQLKGVLLGSFSNYLVTKSSVPVMVARKKLRKQSKMKRTNLRLSNMLQTPGRRLETAAIEKPSKGFR